jgi:hypothetical protein
MWRIGEVEEFHTELAQTGALVDMAPSISHQICEHLLRRSGEAILGVPLPLTAKFKNARTRQDRANNSGAHQTNNKQTSASLHEFIISCTRVVIKCSLLKGEPHNRCGDCRALTTTDVNLVAAFLMTRAVLPTLLAQRWGRIINVTTSLDTMWRSLMQPSVTSSKYLLSLWVISRSGSNLQLCLTTPRSGSSIAFSSGR